MKNIFRRGEDIDSRLAYTLAFILPVICMTIVYALFKAFPFGDKTLFVMDMNDQYSEFFAFFHRVLIGDDSIVYSFTKEMGGNVFGLFTYYLSSPFSFLMLFFSQENLTLGIALMTILKLGACGLTFAVFLRGVSRRRDMSVIIFSCAYALMTYAVHYSMCVMWLDGAIWLPIMLLGVERILDGREPWLFLLSYALGMLSNYYTAYMNTLFIILYFLFSYFTADRERSLKDFGSIVLKMMLAGVGGVLICSVVLLPTFLNMLGGKLSAASYVAEGFFNIDIFKIPRRLFIGQYDSITNKGNPDIFCGMLAGLMTAVFFSSTGVRKRVKIGAALMYAVLIISFFIKRADMVWHIFKYPNWFPYRYAYVFCLFSLLTAFYGFTHIRRSKKLSVIIGILVYSVMLLCVFLFYRDCLLNIRLAVVSLIFAAVYIGAALLIMLGPDRLKPLVCCLLVLMTCGELTLNGYVTLKGLDREFHYVSKEKYDADVKKIHSAVDFAEARDDGFYRMEKTTLRSDNDSMSAGYNGMTHYSSTYNNNVNTFSNRMGLVQEYICARYTGSTVLTDSLMGVKYIASDKPVHDDYTELCAPSAGEYGVYENPYALSIGFAAPVKAIDPPVYTSSYMKNQDMLAGALLGQSFVRGVSSARQTSNGMGIEFTADREGTYYLELNKKLGAPVIITLNGVSRTSEYDNTEKKIHCLGDFKAGDVVNVRFSATTPLSGAKVYSVDTAAFAAACGDAQRSSALNITDRGHTWIEGDITLEEGECVFLSIPYEKGWTAYVDGEKAEPEQAFGAFMMVRADAGEHQVRFKYTAPGLRASMLITILSLACVIVLMNRRRLAGLTKQLRLKQ